MRVQVLGAVRVWRDDHEVDEVDVGTPGRRALLTLLALAGGRPVGLQALIGALWDDHPPRSAVNVVHTHVKHLRRVLEPARGARDPARVLVTSGGGYALRLPDDALDLARFRALVREGAAFRGAGQHREAVTRLAAALRLWCGPPGGGVLSAHPAVTAAVGEWQAAVLALGEAALAADDAPAAVPLLAAAAADAPLDEAVHALLIRAHHAAGDRSAAAAAYQRVRVRLAEELGLDPGDQLRAAHAAVLGGPPPAPPRSTSVVPAQLPAGCPAFVGRDAALRALDAAVDEPTGGTAVVTLDGTAGVGKTALALRWAHRVADRFPDGQLFVDLRGFGPGSPLDPGDVLAGFIEALGLPASSAPVGTTARTGLFRSLLAGKRVLVVLDNARDDEQVRPLLPGAPGCAVVVTSRVRLPGLLVDGARAVGVALLDPAAGRALLAGRLGAARLAAEPDAADRVVAACAGLPLALAVAAARAADTPLADVVADLDEAGRLEALATDEPRSDIRAAFTASHRAVAPGAALLFDLLGLHPSPEVPQASAVALAGTGAAAGRRALRALVAARLLDDRCRGRFRLHDLLHDFSRERARDLPAAVADPALDRLLDHLLHSTRAAVRTLSPHTDDRPVPGPVPGADPVGFADRAAATAWLAAEQETLVASVELATSTGRDRTACEVAAAQRFWLDRRGSWDRMRAVGEAALAAAERVDDPWLRARCHRELMTAAMRLRDWPSGEHHLARARQLFQAADDPVGYAQVLVNGAQLRRKQGRVGEALDDARAGLDLLVRAGHRGQALALSLFGSLQFEAGEHAEALAAHERALALQRDLGYRFGEADTLLAMGIVRLSMGDHRGARRCHLRAAELFREVGDRFCEADSLLRLGDTARAEGDLAAARRLWSTSLHLLTELRNPLADTAHARLASLAGAHP
ncbi:AfsR/SARP family transcriptional regulator [Actinokineospora bangkokensis]|uniref:OmpR/PhoB-type domain-containing protein n=1 Tax=Actinokineospora bangkokensis TaxID=1193682 RepID=A0A1Q9LNQ2_9PSEU|nr:BTAD domain-containing putative transcriptional regulator [Actinokineospora bangkokensis]OLR93629.1 hypothetical protein BJP25_15245 [Actinokineospora bangkokensis]